MGEAKRRKFSDPNYGKVPKRAKKSNDTHIANDGAIGGVPINRRGGASGIRITNSIKCPSITPEEIEKLSGKIPKYITRHVQAKHYEGALQGYFRFSTLMKYRAKEHDKLAGRLGDHQESRIRSTYNTQTGRIKSFISDNVIVSNSHFDPSNDQIVTELTGNDYCSCSSKGRFGIQRAQKLNEAEEDPNEKLGAFVTYHVPTLIKALTIWLERNPNLSSLVPFGKMVSYGHKDWQHEIGETFRLDEKRNTIANWLDLAFVKSQNFSHEEEYRLLLINPHKPGGLDSEAKVIEIESDKGIAAAITDIGHF